jgi:hypothetical protein
MTPEPADPITVTIQPLRVEQPALADAPEAPAASAPSREEMRALEAVFKPAPGDTSAAPVLFGVWAGGMLLHDVAQDHLSRPREEEEEESDKPDGPQG